MTNPFFKNTGPYEINDLLKLISIKNQSILNEKINDIKDLLSSKKGDITFFHSKKYSELAKFTKASFCVTSENLKSLLPATCKPIISDKILLDVAKMTKGDVALNIIEIRKPEIDAKLVADNIAQQLVRRVAFRRAMKRAVQSAMRLGAEGIRINCAGRLGGTEIARTEWYREGRVPLHTLRADVDYGTSTAQTTYGACGVKVWVFKGEILAHDPMAQDKLLQEQQVR